MLKLSNITKDYKVADTKVHALKGINLCFRESEFVSVLGPSGCGKTTMLNIIGGLDKCTTGDLAIYGKSTKQYKDRDWDVYRNHRIGFIFQTYNLIPHQTVLGNVELALTIAGMDKDQRVAKAKAALDKVGLSDQYNKRPNQLSGGQCQRVAIARALVNDPEILLADEPTGALDTVTSKQIMDLVKEISKERLVIMVTHNPEIAEKYSTRIIRMLDGLITSDSKPYSEADEASAAAAKNIANKNNKKQEKAKMSFWTAFKLSFNNLLTKKKRTIMTSIAGSIGIIGVSLVLAISFGVQGFIGDMQNDMLAGNPISISQTAMDINAIMAMDFNQKKDIVQKGNYVNVDTMIQELNDYLSNMQDFRVQNNLDKNYVTYLKDMPQSYWSALNFGYGLDISSSVYTNFKNGDPVYLDGRETSLRGIQEMSTAVLSNIDGFDRSASLLNSLSSPLNQGPDTKNPVTEAYILSQYNVLYNRPGTNGIAKEKNEIMIVLDSDRMLTDLTLGQIGYYSQDEFINLVYKVTEDPLYNESLYDGGKIPYDKISGMTFTWYPNNIIFDEQDPNSSIPFTYSPYVDAGWTDGLELEIVGILEPKDELSFSILDSGFYYTTALAEYIIAQNWNSKLAVYLREVVESDTMSGMAMIFKEGTIIDDPEHPLAMLSIILGLPMPFNLPEDYIVPLDGKIISFNYKYYYEDTPFYAKALLNGGGGGIMSMFTSFMGSGSGVSSVSYSLRHLGGNVESLIEREEDGTITSWEVLTKDGEAFALPYRVSIYPPDLTQKDNVLLWLDAWNSEDTITLSDGTVLTAEMRERVVYSDMLTIIMNMISELINIITIALVGFTSLALIVSCVMIAIITYVSVVERIKEIGVIRSLGGRKRDVSNLFTAETFMIGLASGIIGIGVTYILQGLINLIVRRFAGIGGIAGLPIWVAGVMILLSVGLTFISGVRPSQSAAKKDPVVALRTE